MAWCTNMQVSASYLSCLLYEGTTTNSAQWCRREMADVQSGQRQKPPTSKALLQMFNINTYKFHALGDYETMIHQFRTSDSYSMQVVSVFLVSETLKWEYWPVTGSRANKHTNWSKGCIETQTRRMSCGNLQSRRDEEHFSGSSLIWTVCHWKWSWLISLHRSTILWPMPPEGTMCSTSHSSFRSIRQTL